MISIKQSLLASAALCAFVSSSAYAQDGAFENWSLDGYNTARGDVYDIDGNTAASPFPNGGFHGYNEFGLNASRQYSPYERLNINLQGVLNGSDYRNIDDGLVPERIQVLYENGADGVPYRVQAGDFYAGISYRTLQRSLKGAALELQPFGDRDRKHSIMLFSGSTQPTYRSFDFDDDWHSGFSWLIEDRDWGRASFNVVHSYQDETTPTLTGTDNSQLLYSAAVETPFEFLQQNLIFEGEMAFFKGDYGATAKGQNDTGTFGQLSGRSKSLPLDYRVRYERYGTDYRPNGAIITPDRRSYEAHAGWRFDWGTYLRGRAQRFEDSFDSTNKQRTDLIGANLSGPFFNSWFTGLTGNIDIYQQQIDNELNTIDMDTDVLNASFNAPVYEDWNGQLTLYVQDTDDRLASDNDSNTKQVGLGLFTPVSVWGLSGTINPGIALRDISNNGISDSHEIHPTINMSLADETHRINANYGILNQNRISGTSLDIATQTAGVEYAYTMDRHELGVNGSYYDRDVSGALDTDAWRAGVYWTVRFNKPAGQSLYGANSQSTALGSGATDLASLQRAGLSLMKELEPGGLLARANVLLEENNITGAVQRTGVTSYEANLLDEVIERQRLVLEHQNGKVDKAGLVIDVVDTGSPRSVEQLYERTKQILAKQYGNPDNIVEDGEFTSDIVDDINANRVVRVVEWQTANGVLRYGMPRRLDGQIRLELQHAKRFTSPRNALWSMDLY